MDTFKKEIISRYGEVVLKNDIEIIINKIDAIVTCHCFAGDIGNNQLAVLNRAINKLIKPVNNRSISDCME